MQNAKPQSIIPKRSRHAAMSSVSSSRAIRSALSRCRSTCWTVSFNLLDFGNQQITDPGGTPIGLVLPRNILIAGTYGASIGKRLSLGLTFKQLQYRVDCSGQCANVSTFSASSSAMDFGAQYDLPGDSTIRIGAAVRNIGTKLQVNDGEQADPLPTRIESAFPTASTSSGNMSLILMRALPET